MIRGAEMPLIFFAYYLNYSIYWNMYILWYIMLFSKVLSFTLLASPVERGKYDRL